MASLRVAQDLHGEPLQPGQSVSSVDQAEPSPHHHLITALQLAYGSGNLPLLSQNSCYAWAAACHELLEEDRLDRIDLLEYAARCLHAAFPDIAYLGTLVAWFDAMPRHLPAPLAFRDERAADIQVVRRANCDAVLLCFCARNGTLGLPLNFSHQWLGRLPVSLIYIKDFHDLAGARGYPSLGSDPEASVSGLKLLLEGLNAKRVYALGVSLGGYAALHYGLQLGALGVLGLAAATDLTPGFLGSLEPIAPAHLNVFKQAPEYAKNLFEAYESMRHKPRVILAFSAHNIQDRQHAERMAGLPNVELLPITGYAQHNIVDPLIRQGNYLPLVEGLLSGPQAAA